MKLVRAAQLLWLTARAADEAREHLSAAREMRALGMDRVARVCLAAARSWALDSRWFGGLHRETLEVEP